jgi:hypothetical protein
MSSAASLRNTINSPYIHLKSPDKGLDPYVVGNCRGGVVRGLSGVLFRFNMAESLEVDQSSLRRDRGYYIWALTRL